MEGIYCGIFTNGEYMSSWMGAIASGFGAGLAQGAFGANDPRWADEAKHREAEQEHYEKSGQHIDNALSAGKDLRPFEAHKEAGEGAKEFAEAWRQGGRAADIALEIGKDAAANGDAKDCIIC